MCSLASEYESEWCCVLQICFLMHASAECAEASLLSAINKITEAARAAARLVFDDPSRTGDGSKCPVMQLVNHTHTARNPRLFCIRGCVGNCVEDQRGPSVRPSVLIPSLDGQGDLQGKLSQQPAGLHHQGCWSSEQRFGEDLGKVLQTPSKPSAHKPSPSPARRETNVTHQPCKPKSIFFS